MTITCPHLRTLRLSTAGAHAADDPTTPNQDGTGRECIRYVPSFSVFVFFAGLVDTPRTFGFSVSHATGFALPRVALRDDPGPLSVSGARPKLEGLAEVKLFEPRIRRGRLFIDILNTSLTRTEFGL